MGRVLASILLRTATSSTLTTQEFVAAIGRLGLLVGRRTMQVSHKGKSDYASYMGCRVAFEDDPEKFIKEFAEQQKAKKGPSGRVLATGHRRSTRPNRASVH